MDSLKKQSSRRSVTPETSPRERVSASEITLLKLKLAERDETIKKLKAKNVDYKERIGELREKEMELTKDLSLAEVGIDNSHYRLTFDLDNKNEISRTNLLKVVKSQNLVEKCCNV